MALGVSVQSCLFFQQKSNHAGLLAAWFIRTWHMRIGPYTLPNNLFVAPMAGVTDRPFRKLCKQLGAGYAVSEMVTSRPDLWDSLKTSRRANHEGEAAPIAVQIAGTDAAMMADAARYNIDRGAQIIDINMGCPPKRCATNGRARR
jgi:tRNA-dihydrouridine synthase B